MVIGDDQYMLMKKLKVLQNILSEKMTNANKASKTIPVVYKDLDLEKAERKPADNSTCSHIYNFRITHRLISQENKSKITQ